MCRGVALDLAQARVWRGYGRTNALLKRNSILPSKLVYQGKLWWYSTRTQARGKWDTATARAT